MSKYQRAADDARAKGNITLAQRIETEIKICRQLLVAANTKEVKRFEINGANIDKGSTGLALDTLTESDEGEVIIYYKNDKTAYFTFVFGNDGHDVIYDYGGYGADDLYKQAQQGVST